MRELRVQHRGLGKLLTAQHLRKVGLHAALALGPEHHKVVGTRAQTRRATRTALYRATALRDG